mgnify:CR=1 FL=1
MAARQQAHRRSRSGAEQDLIRLMQAAPSPSMDDQRIRWHYFNVGAEGLQATHRRPRRPAHQKVLNMCFALGKRAQDRSAMGNGLIRRDAYPPT